MHQKFDFGMEPKNNNTSSHMFLDQLLFIWFVAVAFQSEEEVSWKRGPLWPILAPPWIRHWADMAEEPLNICGAMSTSSLPSFVNINQGVL